MFRLPLRTKEQSKISTKLWSTSAVTKLFESFRLSAKDMLLFLNNVTKISISELKNGKLETYTVKCEVSDLSKRSQFHEAIKTCSRLPTRQLCEMQSFHYVMKISDSLNVKKDWLIAQSLGYLDFDKTSTIPEGQGKGLLPRAGVAIHLSNSDAPFRHSIFCTLPLPVSSKFPAHINGHFALDSARRNVWHDPRSGDFRMLWNNFMKRHVIPPLYALAMTLARNHIEGYHHESDCMGNFSSPKDAENGLKWYHKLFPPISELDAEWKPVAEVVYKYLLPNHAILPIALSVPNWRKSPRECLSAGSSEDDIAPVKVNWHTPAKAYFCTSDISFPLAKLLLQIKFPLLSHTPYEVHKSFKEVGKLQDVSPEAVIQFLRHQVEIVNQLPKAVEQTLFREEKNVYEITRYCAQASQNGDGYFENLHGLPLLLTKDGFLRCFDQNMPVFCSKFSDLVSFQSNLFVTSLLQSFYSTYLNKCHDVLHEFHLSDLAQYLERLYPSSWIHSIVHQPWKPDESNNEHPKKEWLVLLWKFIVNEIRDKRVSNKVNCHILECIRNWHIIPTTNCCLAPLSQGKTVLNVNSELSHDSFSDSVIRSILVKLGCPQLDKSIIDSVFTTREKRIVAVCRHYLALVQSTKDVLGLLSTYVNKSNKIPLRHDEIERLLVFFQTGLHTLHTSTLRNLPFYQTIHGAYTCLSGNHTVFEIPEDFPKDDLDVLSQVAHIITLQSAPKLGELYRYIGVKTASSVEFYRDIVLKHFRYLTEQGRINHLRFIKERLIYGNSGKMLLAFLKTLPLIPDRKGVLHLANYFYEPDNIVFKNFVPEDRFPPSSFHLLEWRNFLVDIGLQNVVTKEHFASYANQLQERARNVSDRTSLEGVEILGKSNILVSHLFQNKSLHEPHFLSNISNISFVATAVTPKVYLDMCPAHIQTILTCYNRSVPQHHSLLTWSSASVIASSALPHGHNNVAKNLGVCSNPPYEFVVSHLKNVSGRFSSSTNKEIPETLFNPLEDVMTNIYSFFKDLCPEPWKHSTDDFKRCCNALRDFSVILVDKNTFVRGNQLAFEHVWHDLKPYLFKVPRHLQYFEHFLKGLGAEESPSPHQYVSVLRTIKMSCGENKMHPNENSAAISSTKGLFIRLKRLQNKSVVNPLANVEDLCLPTEGKYLLRSTTLFVNDTMERKERLLDFSRELLIDLTMKDHESPVKLVQLLPRHLQVKKLSYVVKEELSPACADRTCVLDSCDFMNHYRQLLVSREFSEELIRLYKYQQEKDKIPPKVEMELRKLESSVEVVCMQNIALRLMKVQTNEVITGSDSDVSCFCQPNECGFRILIKHGGDANSSVLHERLSSFVSSITGNYLEEKNWRFLMMLLDARSVSDLSRTLDDARIPRTISALSSLPPLGNVIPVELHYLLKNDVRFVLREGEFVGYEVQDESELNDSVYIFAKIIEQSQQGDGRLQLNSKYKIDIGNDEPIEVSKLKLFKFDREQLESTNDHEQENVDRPTRNVEMEIMLYENLSGESFDNTANETKSNITLEEAKKEVAEALAEIWKLPESERRTAIKRLIRQWHPDKNPDRKDLATQVTQFLLNEVERLEKGGIPGYQGPEAENSHHGPQYPPPPRPSDGYWDGFFERESERSRKRERWRSTGDDEYEPSNLAEAKVWMQQSEIDLNAARVLSTNEEETFFALSCFHSQQAVEKALKALMFFKGRLKRSDLEVHDVMGMAYRAAQINAQFNEMPFLVMVFQNRRFYINTRYPQYRRWVISTLPTAMFTESDANEALSNAEEVLSLVKHVIRNE
ncbi:sacsin-like [Xenia sp. Carnegie-2017]|uniref:sacsin-like n=1 Tax=Xenia sp. Carnegie-2017 TaxID=2897299 RepID=UPI001F035645|nr:sacsin-like [Xenia sp. Carnegie-2017]